MVIAILVGFLAANIVGYAVIYAQIRAVRTKLEELERVGVLITGKHAPEQNVRKIGRRELIRAIEKRSTEKV